MLPHVTRTIAETATCRPTSTLTPLLPRDDDADPLPLPASRTAASFLAMRHAGTSVASSQMAEAEAMAISTSTGRSTRRFGKRPLACVCAEKLAIPSAQRTPQAARSHPATRPGTTTTTVSTRHCRRTRAREAPSAVRSASSRLRSSMRARKTMLMLTQPRSRSAAAMSATISTIGVWKCVNMRTAGKISTCRPALYRSG